MSDATWLSVDAASVVYHVSLVCRCRWWVMLADQLVGQPWEGPELLVGDYAEER